jgi:hypothetical protein
MSLKKIYVLFISLFASFIMYGQEVIDSKLSKDTILIGDQIEWFSRIKLPKGVSIKVDSLANPIVEGVELIEQVRIDTLTNKRKFSDIEIKATITSFDSGSYLIPQKTFYFYKNELLTDSVVIGPFPLEVTTIPVDTTSFELNNIKGQFTYPVSFKEILPWILLVLIVAAMVYLIYKIIKNRRENKTIFGRPIIKDPPHIVALRTLDKIRNDQLWQNNKTKQFYTSVTDALRQYLEGRFNISAMERTSKEIIEELNGIELPKNEFEQLKELFELADLVKFAKYASSVEENEKAIPTAVRFVNATFLQEIEEGKDGK